MADDDLKKSLARQSDKADKGTKGKLDSLKKGASDNAGRLAQAAGDRIARARAGAAAADLTYTVAAGDSLSAIAKKHYGSADKWQLIYEANKTIIGANPNSIKVGQKLALPAID